MNPTCSKHHQRGGAARGAANRRGAGVDDRGGLENRCGPRGHRGFESHPLRRAYNIETAFRYQKALWILGNPYSVFLLFLHHSKLLSGQVVFLIPYLINSYIYWIIKTFVNIQLVTGVILSPNDEAIQIHQGRLWKDSLQTDLPTVGNVPTLIHLPKNTAFYPYP